MDSEPLLGPQIARRLERLKWILRKRITGGGEGEMAGRKKGGLIEFADHREYSPGDDLRYVDWNAYARLGILTIKEFAKEEEVPLKLLLDISTSMGSRDGEKFRLALRTALGLGFIALSSRNPVEVMPFSGESRPSSRAFAGTDALLDFSSFLQNLTPSGETDLGGALRAAGAASKSSALIVLISDLMAPDSFHKDLAALVGRGCEICVLRVLTPVEATPDLLGPISLVDAETGATLDLDLTAADLDEYRNSLAEADESFRRFTTARGIRFVSVRSDTPFEEVVLDTLREANWLRFGK